MIEYDPQSASRRQMRFWLPSIGLLVVALTVFLATRTFRMSGYEGASVQARSSQAIRQHMDRDAAQWFPPAPRCSQQKAPSFYPRVSPAGPPLSSQLLDESLYNRPPPLSC